MFKKYIVMVFVTIITGVVFQVSCSLEGEGLTTDPNRATDVSANQSFTAVQVEMYIQFTGAITRMTAMWIEHIAGTDRQEVNRVACKSVFGQYCPEGAQNLPCP